MQIRKLFEDIGCGSLWVLTASQLETVLRIANLILAITISVLIIVSRLIDWFKKAKKDGKITSDEVKEGVEIIKEGAEEIKGHIEEHK